MGCSAEGKCTCKPNCTNKKCGSDGCQGTCGNCKSDEECINYQCQKKPCGSKTPAVSGKFKAGSAEIPFDKVSASVTHKRDIDEQEDGCIVSVTLSFGYGDGCKLTVNAGNKYVGTGTDLSIVSIQFSADSQCPGFPDASEGTYSLYSNLKTGKLSTGVSKVPDKNSESSCFSASMILTMEGELKEYYGSKTLNIALSTLTVSGEFISEGYTESSCPCKPACSGKQCGNDGCYGTCGDCKDGADCVDGKCVNPDSCSGYCSKTAPGGCGCSDTCFNNDSCCEDVCTACPTLTKCSGCTCTGKECGDNGCGQSCGECTSPETCQNNKCVSGTTGCGSSYPACKECVCKNLDSWCCTGWDSDCSEHCNDSACKTSCASCTPNCSGKECGDNGCSGTCGTCSSGYTCTNPHFSPSFYCGLENAAAKLVSAEIALNILSSMPRLFPLPTSLFAGIFVAS
jgi:hypothetical protein